MRLGMLDGSTRTFSEWEDRVREIGTLVESRAPLESYEEKARSVTEDHSLGWRRFRYIVDRTIVVAVSFCHSPVRYLARSSS